MKEKTQKERRKTRVRMKIKGTAERPRLSVFRSNRMIYVQLIDDEARKTLLAANEKEIKAQAKQTKTEKARLVGEILAKKALKKKIREVVFDRSLYHYHGRVKALADGAREGGLKF